MTENESDNNWLSASGQNLVRSLPRKNLFISHSNLGFLKEKHIPEKSSNCQNHIAGKGQNLKAGLDYLSSKYFHCYVLMTGWGLTLNSCLLLWFANEDTEAIDAPDLTQLQKKNHLLLWSFHCARLFSISHLLWACHSLNESRGSCKGRGSLQDPVPEPKEISLHRKHSVLCWETYCEI